LRKGRDEERQNSQGKIMKAITILNFIETIIILISIGIEITILISLDIFISSVK